MKTFLSIPIVILGAFSTSVLAEPDNPHISGSTIQNDTTVSDVQTEGVQGSNAGGGGGLGIGPIRIGGSGGTSRGELPASTVIGGVDINSGSLQNSKVLNRVEATAISNRGSTVNVGYIRLGK